MTSNLDLKRQPTPTKLVVIHVYKDFHIYNALFGTMLLLARQNDASTLDLRLCIFNYRKSAWGDEFEQLGGKIIDLGARRLEGPFSTFKLLKCFRRERPDIVQTHELKANLYGRFAARWARVPVIIGTIWTLKDTAPSPLRRLRDRILHPLSAWLDRRSDRVLTISDAIRREWDASLQSPLYQTIYLPVDLERPVVETHFPVAMNDPATFKVGVLARLSEEKGLPTLLEAMPPILQSLPNAMLFIAGDGRMLSALEVLTARLKLSAHVHFLGHIGDVPEFLSKVDLYVQPSRSDVLPVSIMEALAAGLPVIATRVGGIPEVITDGTNGRLIPPNDVGALAQAIITLGKDAGQRRKFGDAGRRTMDQRFQPSEFVREMNTLYTELMTRATDTKSGAGEER